MLNKSILMHRAWSLLRQSMRPFSRPAFAARYPARREGAAYVLKRDGVEFGRLIGPADRLAFTSTDAALAERVRSTFVPWAGVPAALAKVRAADEALRLARIA